MLCQTHLNLPKLAFPTVHYKRCVTWVFTHELVPDNLALFQPVLSVA